MYKQRSDFESLQINLVNLQSSNHYQEQAILIEYATVFFFELHVYQAPSCFDLKTTERSWQVQNQTNA